jgi:hypothetical protein
LWDETEGGRVSQDTASCLRKHLKANAAGHKNITLYSDPYTGKKWNIKMMLTLLQLAQDLDMNVEKTDHKFMVPGHSFLPNGTEFGTR